MKRKLTQEQIDQVVHMYTIEKMGTVEIGKKMGVSYQTVNSRLRERNVNITHASYKLNDNYFSKIDTEQKAYFLGLLYADGNLHRTKYKTTLVLSEKDKYIIEEFKKELDTKKPIYYVKERKIAGTSYTGKAAAKLEISSEQIHCDLITHGCTPAKSLTLNFPSTVPKNFMNHFIRGYFDGDGCIYNSQNRIMINVIGSENFCKSFVDFLKVKLDILTKVKSEKRGLSFYFSIMKIKDVVKFCEFIYSNSTVKLQRKYQKYIDYLETENWEKNGTNN
jgi:hypothetical protein